LTADRRSPVGVAAAAIAAGCALAVPATVLVATGADSGRAAWDAAIYHERVIRGFIETFPAIDARNPLTTTTPGYHVAMAAFGSVVSDSPTAIRLAAVAVGTAFVGLVGGWCAARRGATQGVLLALPLACSLYVIGSAAWPLPDDAAWLLVALALAACLGDAVRGWRAAGLAATLAALVTVRQVHAWALLPAAVACLMPGPPGEHARAARRAGVAAATVLPATLALAAFVVLWGGLVPPRFRSDVTGINPATPAFVLLQFAVAGAAFLPWLAGSLRSAWTAHRAALLAAAAAGLLLAAVPATSTDADAGRSSGWWNVLGHVPAIAGRTNPAMLVLCPAGAALLASALASLRPRERAVMSAALLGFVAAVTATRFSWQRYHEPFVLMFLAMLSALQPGGRPSARWMAASIASLCALLWAIAWQGLSGPPVDRTEQPAPGHVAPGERFPATPGVQVKTEPSASATGGQ
jgi:hypothetical protein